MRRVAIRAFAVWLVLIGGESIHGVIRTILVAPHLGDVLARQISVFTGSVLVLFVAYLFIRWIGAENTESLLCVGVGWLVLTVLFEMGVGHFALRRSWETLASDYNISQGGLLPIGLAVLVSPLVARLSGLKRNVQRG